MASVRRCVYCRERQVDERWRPFCSERCKMLDLAAWADGKYRMAGDPVPSPVESDAPDDER